MLITYYLNYSEVFFFVLVSKKASISRTLINLHFRILIETAEKQLPASYEEMTTTII